MSFKEDFTTKDSSFVYIFNDTLIGRTIKRIQLKKGKNLSKNNEDSNFKSDVKIITSQFFKNIKSPIIHPIDLEKGLLSKILKHEIKLDNKVIYIIDEIEKWGAEYIAKEVYLTTGGKRLDYDYSFSNNIEYKSLKGKDTIYFYFDYSKHLEKSKSHVANGNELNYYKFKENNVNNNFQRYIIMFKRPYLTNENKVQNKKADVKVISKSYLRKNKDIVIYPKDLEGEKMEKVIGEISAVVYIIDTSEKKGNKFKAREVKFSFGSFITL